MTPGDEDREERVAQAGRAAWVRLQQHKTWSDWMAVAEAFQVGRGIAMRLAGTNQPAGRGYAARFGEWLEHYRLTEIDRRERAALLEIMENRCEIESWRGGLPQSLRVTLNHPVTTLQRWKRDTIPKPKRLRRPAVDLQRNLESAAAQIQELEGERQASLDEIADLRRKNTELESQLQTAQARIREMERVR